MIVFIIIILTVMTFQVREASMKKSTPKFPLSYVPFYVISKN